MAFLDDPQQEFIARSIDIDRLGAVTGTEYGLSLPGVREGQRLVLGIPYCIGQSHEHAFFDIAFEKGIADSHQLLDRRISLRQNPKNASGGSHH